MAHLIAHVFRTLALRDEHGRKELAQIVKPYVAHVGPPKSRKGHRRIEAPVAVLELLSKLRSTAADPNGLIFRGPEGRRMDPDYFDTYVFGPIAEQAYRRA